MGIGVSSIGPYADASGPDEKKDIKNVPEALKEELTPREALNDSMDRFQQLIEGAFNVLGAELEPAGENSDFDLMRMRTVGMEGGMRIHMEQREDDASRENGFYSIEVEKGDDVISFAVGHLGGGEELFMTVSVNGGVVAHYNNAEPTGEPLNEETMQVVKEKLDKYAGWAAVYAQMEVDIASDQD